MSSSAPTEAPNETYPLHDIQRSDSSDPGSLSQHRLSLSPTTAEGNPRAPVDREDQSQEGYVLVPTWRNNLPYFGLWFFTLIWLVLTTCWAFLTSSTQPLAFFAKPEMTIFFLNLGTASGTLLLRELVVGAFEQLRWSLASKPSGVAFAIFLGFGRATSFLACSHYGSPSNEQGIIDGNFYNGN